ncbi:MAG: PorT family protein [Aureispira sp.]|nr:PorT family protein [Aureispira sp.]
MKVLFLLLSMVGCVFSNAQTHNIGIQIGISNYLGDLTPSQKAFLYESNLAVGVSYQYQITPRFSAKTTLTYCNLSGSDHHFDNDQKQRNLNFRSELYEIALLGTFNFIKFKPLQEKMFWTPYIYAGIAGFYFNPKTQFNGDWVELQPLGTEGQGIPIDKFTNHKKYSRYQVAIPFGFGAKFSMSKRIDIALEVGTRKTFTDYIDDVSLKYVSHSLLETHNGSLAAELSNRTYTLEGEQVDLSNQKRGSLKGDDWYFISSFTINYTIGKILESEKPEKTKKRKYMLNKWL